MPNTSKNALVVALILGTASAVLATDAYAANNYDSSDWASMYAGPSAGSEPKADVRSKNTERFVPAPSERLSHKTDGPR